jgi:hypothetical protein
VGRLREGTAVTSGGVRRFRSCAFAASAVALALGAHVTAHGAPPDALLLLLLVALGDGVSSTYARRPRGPVATAAALVTTQLVLHVVFVLAAPDHGAHADHVLTLPMLVTHGFAAVVLAVLLSHGERLVARAAGLLLPVLLLRPFRPVPVGRPVVAAAGEVPLRPAASVHDISRRGPPTGSAAART